MYVIYMIWKPTDDKWPQIFVKYLIGCCFLMSKTTAPTQG